MVALISRVKDNKEFLQKNPNLFSKSPKEVIIAVKRFEFDKKGDRSKKNEIRQYYHLKENETLIDEQINEYLYKKAIGEITSQSLQQNNPTNDNKKDNKIMVTSLIIGGGMIFGVGLILVVVIRKRKKTISKKYMVESRQNQIPPKK